MAPMTSPDIAVRPQRSILTLDKSEESFPTQIRTASSILGIRLDQQWTEIIEPGGEQIRRPNTISDPRHGHALRWLLRKLQSGETGLSSPRLQFRAWILLRQLLIRTPLATAARLLKEHKFINTLKQTFHWLRDNFNREQLPSCLTRPDSSVSGSGSDSGSGSSDEQNTARKRTRDGTETVPHRNLDGRVDDLDTLYVAICRVVKQLMDFIIDPGHVHGYAAEHMRAALKSSPEEAAIMLEGSMYLVNHILQTPSRSRRRKRKASTQSSQRKLEGPAFESCIFPMTEFWNLYYSGGHGSIDEPQNRAFMRCCLLPSLLLLHTLQEGTLTNKEVDGIKESLTSLLIKHVVLPFRVSSGLVNQNKPQRVVSAVVFVDALTMSLRSFRSHEPITNIDSRAGTKTKAHLTATCLSLLFHIASTCRPMGTSASRRTESSWLESLFTQILTCASVVLNPSPSVQTQKELVRLTKWMLRRALDNKVTLSTATLESILDKTAGLLDEEYGKGHVIWGLVSLCLLNDPNVFVIPSVTSKVGQDHLIRTPNKFLIALFSHITEDICRRPISDDNDHSFKLENVILPLLHAFADARNLVGFIAHWKEQLRITQERCHSNVKSRNALLNQMAIWEDDILLHAVADLCKINLTIGQMESLFEQAQQDLRSLGSPVGGLFSSIVILDCVVSGFSREETLSKLAEPAHRLFGYLASIFATKPDLVQGYQWRLWRIMTVINDRWGQHNEPQSPGESAYSAATRARDLLCLENSKIVSEVEPDYSDRLHSFNFLLSFATSEYLDLHDVSLRDIMVQAIGKVMDLKEFFCRQLREDHFGVLKPLHADPQWTGRGYGIKSIDSLYIGCIARLLQSPKALSCLDLKQLERLFEQLYRLAIHRRTSSQLISEQYIDYDWLWQALGRSDVLTENANIANCLRGFEATQFLNLFGSKDPRYWNINTVQYSLAFETIQRTPSSALSKRHRIEVADQIFRIMLYKKVLSLAKMTEYIGLLTQLVEHQHKKMAILSNASGLSQDNPTEAEIRHDESKFEPALIVLADKINEEPWSVDNVDCFIALRRLTRAVMRHLISTMTIGTSLQYLKVFYGWLSGALKDEVNSSEITPPRLIVIGEVLISYSRHRAEVTDSLKRELETLDVLRQRHLETLIENIDVAGRNLSEPKPRHYCGMLLESMVSYSDLLCIHPDLRNISARLAVLVDRVRKIRYTGGTAFIDVRKYFRATDYLQSRFTRLEYALGSFDNSLHPSFLGTVQILRKMQSSEKADLLRHFQEQMSTVGWQQKEDLLNTLTIKQQDQHHDRVSLEVLQRTLFSIEDRQLDDLGPALSGMFITLCNNMLQTNEAHVSIISMQCMSNLLQKNHRIISQWHIDSLLASVTIKASHLRPTNNSQQVPLCHLGLCRLLNTALTRHRSKIGGRYHLVLPALQSLLRCLFTRYFLASDNDDPPSALAPAQASGYARLLTTLADPTVSSVRSSKKRSWLDLNDNTKKARSIAGQHLPYLIMEYCMCQLKGRLAPEMKAALEPGLYAVLNVMTKEGMRTMNAALDESGRAVWKALYEDWRKFER